jgi:hypothetical protein
LRGRESNSSACRLRFPWFFVFQRMDFMRAVFPAVERWASPART